MPSRCILLPPSNLLIHRGGVGLVGNLVDLRDLDLDGALAERDLDDVAHLDLIAGLHLPAVHAHALAVAGLVRDRAALDEAGYLQIFVKSHGTLLVLHKKARAQARA